MYRPQPQWKARQPVARRLPSVRAPAPSRLDPSLYKHDDRDKHDKDNFDEVAQIARSGYKLARELMGELNVEYKIIQGLSSDIRPDSAGADSLTVSILNSCTQGDTDTTRNGDSIKISNLMFRGHIANMYAAITKTDYYWVRCIVYWTHGCDSIAHAFPTNISSTDGLLDYLYKGTDFADLAPKDYDLDANTKILWDKTWSINSNSVSHRFEKLIKVNRHTQYENDSGTIATGTLKCIWISNVPVAVTNRPQVDFAYRVYFVDN